MREEKQTVVLDNTSNPKNAALFFGDVIPNPFGVAESYYNGEISSHQLKPIFPPQFQESEEYAKFWDKVYHTGKLLKVSRKLGEADAPEWLLTLDRLLACSLEHMSYIKGKFAPGTLVYLYSSAANELCTESYDCTSLELAHIPLIDTSQTEWEQIIKFREDKKSVDKLRRLISFFHKNYSGKDKKFVEDELCQTIEDSENAIKDWGFNTVVSSILLLGTSVHVLNSSIASALTGEPLEVAAKTSLCVAVGGGSLLFAIHKRNLSVLQRDHPLAYIIDAKKKLE